jgi:hypothetical protein
VVVEESHSNVKLENMIQKWKWQTHVQKKVTLAILAPHDSVAISSPECTHCEHSDPPINDRLEEDMPKSTCK